MSAQPPTQKTAGLTEKEILVSDELKKVKASADSACRWLFMDVSCNQSRRWCDMKDCGNRAKAARCYQKKQIQWTIWGV